MRGLDGKWDCFAGRDTLRKAKHAGVVCGDRQSVLPLLLKSVYFFLHVEFVVGMAFYEFLYIEFVVGVAFSEFLSCIIGSGCCVLGGCLGWSSIRLSIVIKVCISFLTCRNCSRRFGVVLSVTICGGRRSVPLL